jgi:hypothetical protein
MKKMPFEHSILVVDDEVAIRESLCGLLEYYGYYVATAGRGSECLQILSALRFDLVILDVVMPELNGIEVLQEIKKKYSDTEVIMITGYADKEKAIAAFRLNAYDFIEKPYKPEEILNTIRNCLKQSELRKEIESKSRELKESEERFRQIFEQNEDALMIFEPMTYKIIDANPSAENLFGYTKDEFLKNGLALFRKQGDFSNIKEIICDISEGKGFRSDQKAFIRKDGTGIVVTIQGKTIRLKDNDVVYCSFRDITEKIRMKEEARFVQTKLIHVNKMTSLGMLASGIAHEINNPNNLIMFNAPLISEAWQDSLQILTEYYRENGDFSVGGLLFSEMKELMPRLISGIGDGSLRIKNIVDNLKDFTRQEKAVMNGLVDLNKVIKTSVSILNNQIRKYTEKFVLACDKNLPPVKGSAQQLEQVIINLIMNSLQALPDKKCGIWVSTAFDNEELRYAVIKVRDEGAGMSREVLDRIMEPFFTTKLDTGGTGLGLSISCSIIKEHQGSLEFESRTGEGTTATIRLPCTVL